MDQWLNFTFLFDYGIPGMRASCSAWGVPNNSDQEIADMREAILSVSAQTGVDARFILAVIIQESSGCVRVITTAYSHNNPGLMQSFNGTGTCNTNSAYLGLPGVAVGRVITPCPASTIRQQIEDGAAGTQWGPGLQQDLSDQIKDAQGYYRAARIYNGGTFIANDLSQPCCTASYVADIANRLMGWAYSPRTYQS
ncbi:hypothetical protein LTR37_017543 [Vermiconidia calcicola]|uniref:Uncharacterized protein n=1 Tax=Vermiconidia calcicola TaxID=1690605 RepID=A0ACC3MJN2_9PEZI|nr:hypothetical protein LTR37_017543 [Vermiconidia calcicola]